MTELQHRTWQVIRMRPRGFEITGRDLGRLVQVEDQKDKPGANMRAVINALRSKGYPICANGKGYYVARIREELEEYISSLQGRIEKIQKSLSGLLEAKPLEEIEAEESRDRGMLL